MDGLGGNAKHLKKRLKKKQNTGKKASLTKVAHNEARKIAKLKAKNSMSIGSNGQEDSCHQSGIVKAKRNTSRPSLASASREVASARSSIIEGEGNVSSDFMSKQSSFERAKAAFSWMIAPVQRESFYSEYFEKKAFVVKHKNPAYYKQLFSTNNLDDLMHNHDLYFGKNIDITSYVDSKRETHNPEGRAVPAQVWSMYNDGCSVRLLNPQTFVGSVHTLCYTLAEEFSSFVGANVYLTPPNTQGFAPHWDDIDAFVLQLEGRKHWKVYAPRCPEEELPLNSSKNLERHELGELILETVLETGDLLYMPRGFIHEAQSSPDTHSLHITISANQHNTWSDFFKLMLPGALQVATEEDLEFRRTMPRDYLRTMGIMYSDSRSAARDKFLEMASKLFDKLVDCAPIDAAVDQMAKNFIHDSLPPVLPAAEQKMSAAQKAKWNNGKPPLVELNAEAEVRILSRTACRIVTEGDMVNMYYINDNTKTYREHDEPFSIELTPLEANVIEFLLTQYPKYIRIKDLPYEGSIDDKVELAIMLFQKGLLLAK